MARAKAKAKTTAARSEVRCGGAETCGWCLARHPAVGGALSEEEVAEIHLDRRRIRLAARRRLTEKIGGDAALINLTVGAVKISPMAGAGERGKVGPTGAGGPDANGPAGPAGPDANGVGGVEGVEGVGVIFAPDIVSPRDGAITALTDCEVCCFSAAGLRRLFARHPRLQERFLRHSLEALHRAREQAALFNRPRAMERVAGLFWSCVRASASRGGVGGEVVMPMRGVEMAALLGLSKETVSRCVSALRTDGLLRPLGRSRFGVPNPDALREVCGGR